MANKSPINLPSLTAVLTCRNAASTLKCLLEHLRKSGAKVIMVDNGSTDETRQIAERFTGDPVFEIIDEPFEGVFDLSRQLNLKRDIIRTINNGWVMHVDADEFLDAPTGLNLREHLAVWDESEHVAFSCIEQLFLPRCQNDIHKPESFQETMRYFVSIQERDPKQRLFRCDAPLDVWMRTGGHTVSINLHQLVPEPLALRHYLGLSLDDLRSQYLSRVFSPSDVAKYWHSNRMIAQHYDIVEPPIECFSSLDQDELEISEAIRTPPIFLKRDQKRHNILKTNNAHTDLLVLVPDEQRAFEISQEIERKFTDLRYELIVGSDMEFDLPECANMLNLLQHPAALSFDEHDVSGVRESACDWTRRLAVIRQNSLRPDICYKELRVEDIDGDPKLLIDAIRNLLMRSKEQGLNGFVPVDAKIIRYPKLSEITERIASPLARDLGYF